MLAATGRGVVCISSRRAASGAGAGVRCGGWRRLLAAGCGARAGVVTGGGTPWAAAAAGMAADSGTVRPNATRGVSAILQCAMGQDRWLCRERGLRV